MTMGRLFPFQQNVLQICRFPTLGQKEKVEALVARTIASSLSCLRAKVLPELSLQTIADRESAR